MYVDLQLRSAKGDHERSLTYLMDGKQQCDTFIVFLLSFVFLLSYFQEEESKPSGVEDTQGIAVDRRKNENKVW